MMMQDFMHVKSANGYKLVAVKMKRKTRRSVQAARKMFFVPIVHPRSCGRFGIVLFTPRPKLAPSCQLKDSEMKIHVNKLHTLPH